ncbi:MAG: LysM peptidoglycan-binding domain-containing protein, partial [Phycisphaerales bacterium]|nr:LysM peptidoglycan-binding domain-containing protein [Phycisphaerales bacterium]
MIASRFLLTFVLFFCVHYSLVKAQPATSSLPKQYVESKDNTFYLVHIIEKGETLYRIGFITHTSVKDIVKYNNIVDPNHLEIGELIFIPIPKDELLKETSDPDNTTPLYIKTRKGDNLWKISRQFGRVSVSYLMKSNNMTSDVIEIGYDYLVGYLNFNIPPSFYTVDNDMEFEVYDDRTKMNIEQMIERKNIIDSVKKNFVPSSLDINSSNDSLMIFGQDNLVENTKNNSSSKQINKVGQSGADEGGTGNKTGN